MGAMTRIVDDLEDEGLVRRERTERDRRVVEIALTPQGRKYLQTGKRLVVELLNSLAEPFSRQELETLIALLQRMMARLQEAQMTTLAIQQPQEKPPRPRARSATDAPGSDRSGVRERAVRHDLRQSLRAAQAGWISRRVWRILKNVGPYALVESRSARRHLARATALALSASPRKVSGGRRAPRCLSFRAPQSRARGLHRRPQFRQARGACDSLFALRAGQRRRAALRLRRRSGGRLVPAFRSAALDQLVRQALRSSPDLDAARHGLAAAQDELRAVSGAALPQINAAGKSAAAI